MNEHVRTKYFDYLPLFGRFGITLIFIVNGLYKALEFNFSISLLVEKGFSVPEFFLVLSVAIELIGGIMVLIGYRTRPVAFIMSVYLILATFIYHPIWADMNNYVDFSKNLAIIGALMLLAYHGPGPKSVDTYHSS